jgi:pilus assembly protein CpaE
MMLIEFRRSYSKENIEPEYHPLKARLYTIYSNKGGVGKTSLAVAFASELAKQGFKALLLELDSSPGDLATLFGLNPFKNIITAILDDNYLESVYPLRENLSVLLGPPSPLVGEGIKVDEIRKLICFLQRNFEVLVVDTQPLLTTAVVKVMQLSDEVFFVLTPQTAAVARLNAICELMSDLGIDKEKLRLVINMKRPSDPLNLGEIVQAVDLPLVSIVKYDPNLHEQAFYSSAVIPRNTLTKAMEELVRELHPRSFKKALKFWRRR